MLHVADVVQYLCGSNDDRSHGWCCGRSQNCRKNVIYDVRFADDQGMIASSETGLQKIMNALNNTATKYDMKINIKKTKVMRVSRVGGKVNITINGVKIEQVKSFKYLGHTMTEDGKCVTEIDCRIAQAKEAFSNRKELLTKSLKKQTKT